jgi:hypothetical protein
VAYVAERCTAPPLLIPAIPIAANGRSVASKGILSELRLPSYPQARSPDDLRASVYPQWGIHLTCLMVERLRVQVRDMATH